MVDDPKTPAPNQNRRTSSTDQHVPEPASTIDPTGAYHPDPHDTVESISNDRSAVFDLPTIPGYSVSGEIARGGMGRVLAARDLSLDREVAIKVMLATAAPAATDRFVTETKVTARLPHPGIPPVHACGTLADRSPFLVMKRVDGQTLGELLEQRKSVKDDLAKWVAVFEQVCQAVGFAHSQGILHRDLKPSNVMVGAFGEVHVMDWGLARDVEIKGEQKATEYSSADATGSGSRAIPAPALTATGAVIGTPAYMPPEQAQGKVVDTRADVFALGGLLAAILTGKPTFIGNSSIEVIGKAASGEMDEAFHRLDGCQAEIELIALAKSCLSPERDARPPDGQAVAHAVAEYRAGVEERLRKAQAERAAGEARAVEQRKRRKVLTVAVGIVMGALLIGGSAAALQWMRAEDALAELSEEQGRTQQKVTELTQSRKRNVDHLTQVTNELVGNWMERQASFTEAEREVIDGLLPMWEELAAARGDTPEARNLRATGHFRVAFLQKRIGRLTTATRKFRRARKLYGELSDEFPADPQYRQRLAITCFNLGLVTLRGGLEKESEGHYRTALDLFEVLTTEDPRSAEYRHGLATTHINLAVLLEDRGEGRVAEQHYRTAISLFDALVPDSPENPDFRQGKAIACNNLGVLLQRLGRVEEAEKQFRAALTLREKLVDEFSDVPRYRRDLADTQENLGVLVSDRGYLTETEKRLRDALAIRKALVSDFPAVPKNRQRLARTGVYLGVALAKTDRLDEAEEAFRTALGVSQDLAAEHPMNSEYLREVAESQVNLGSMMLKRDRDPSKAEAQLRQALEGFQRLVDAHPARPRYLHQLSMCRLNLGGALVNRGGKKQAEEAEEQFRRALDILNEVVAKFPEIPEYRRTSADIRHNFGVLCRNHERWEEAEAQYRAAIVIREKLTADFPEIRKHHEWLAHEREKLGDLLVRRDSPKDIEENYHRILAAYEQLVARFPDIHRNRPKLAMAHTKLALWLQSRGRAKEAEKQLRSALALLRKWVVEFPDIPKYRQGLAETHNVLGSLLEQGGRREAAEEQYGHALALVQKLIVEFPDVSDHQVSLGGIHCNFGHLLRGWGRLDESQDWYRKAIAILEPAVTREPENAISRRYLRNSHLGRAKLHDGAKNYPEAAADWSRVIKLSPVVEQPGFRGNRAVSRLQAGMVKEAVADVDAIAPLPIWQSVHRYNFACVYAIASGKVEDPAGKNEYASKAVDMLRAAVKGGWKPSRNPTTDRNFAPLRNRDDFQGLAAELGWETPKP